MTFTYRRSSFALYGWLLAIVAIMAAMFLLLASTNEASAQTSVPAKPTGLTAKSVTHESVTLTWDDPGDDSITGYQALRRSRDGEEYGDGQGAAEFVAVVDDTGTSAANYNDTSVAGRTRYVYRVKAWNAQGLGGASDDAEAETAEGIDSLRVQPCQEGYVAPTPTEVPVTAVPIVVESTTADYFVLYVSHDVGGTPVEYPVRVVLGEDGTTTFSENVAPLPKDRYRVEKYSVAEPADVDGDCTDDITELNDLGRMNPVNSGVTIESGKGAVAIPDMETFEALAHRYSSGSNRHVKFVIYDFDTDRPSVYFQNMSTFTHHMYFIDDLRLNFWRSLRGMMSYDPEMVSVDGHRGRFSYSIANGLQPFGTTERIHTLLAASMPLLDDNLALRVTGGHVHDIQPDLPQYRASRIHLALDEDTKTDFQALNPGEGYGLLRHLDPDDRPHSRDVVIYEALPNELPRVAGIISTVPQTSLSHVNLRAIQDNVPNAFIRNALNDDFSDLLGTHVYYAVTDAGYAIRAATAEEVDQHYASSRPAEPQTPERDLSVTEITALSEVGFDDWDSFGVKAANVAVLGTLAFPEGTVPDGFAIPFYFYDEFMKHNELYDDVREMLADPDFQSDYGTKVSKLKKLRKKIKKAETPDWIETALTTMHATFPEGTSLRYRSSTNNEDLPGFNGAGLYDSKTQHPDETEEDGISKSLKQVFASLWNFRAFIERDFHRIDHMATAMGVLVHPNYSDELVNGVAVSTDPAYGTEGTHYVNSQLGEDLVTNPEAHSVPEEALLDSNGTYGVVSFSNQVPPGQLLMTRDQAGQLRGYLATSHERFAELYGAEYGEPFAIEIEFKITSDNVVAIKQARPWVFAVPPSNVQVDYVTDTDSELTGEFKEAPETHDGNPFFLTLQFGEDISIGFQELWDYSLKVTGGRVTRANRVDDRRDLWVIRIRPDSLRAVTVRVPHNLPCMAIGAVCTEDGHRLSNQIEYTVEGRHPSFPRPPVPERPTGQAHSPGVVDLEWNDVPYAIFYDVQFQRNGRWVDLPNYGIEVRFDETGAVIKGLPATDAYNFRVRAGNGLVSGWSAPLFMPARLYWESELTAAQSTEVVPAALGYSIYGSLGGDMSPDRIVLDGTTYRIHFLAYAMGSLWLGVDQELPVDFTLLVGDVAFHRSESKAPSLPSVAGGYWWSSVAPDWRGDDPVRVGLVIRPGVPLGDRQKAPVTGEFKFFPAEHDGQQDVSFRIYFSEGVDTTADALRNHVLSVSGGTVSGVEVVGDEGRIWGISVTPDSLDPVTVEIEPDLDCALPEAVCTEDGRQLFNRMVLTVEPVEGHPPTGAPTISGVAEVGETLTAGTSGISDANGMTGATFSYQWVSYDGRAYTDIQGATDSTYTLVPADEGLAFRVRVSFLDDAGYRESLTSALAVSERPYALAAKESDGAVVLTWKVPVGINNGSLFRILRNRPELGETEPLVYVEYAQGRATSYTDTDVEPGVLYVYRVKGVNLFGIVGEASDPASVRVAANSPATGGPTITGTAQVGQTLTADTSGISDADGLTNATFTYQWLRGNADISGATDSAYNLASADAGNTISVRVSFNDDDGHAEGVTSAATAAVEAAVPGAPQSVAVVRGGTGELDISWEAPASDGGGDITGYTVQWKKTADSWDTTADVSQAATTGTTHTITGLDLDVEYSVRVFATNSAGNGPTSADVTETAEAQSSQQQQETVENSAATGTPTISGAPVAGQTLTASTSGIADEDGLTNATFSYEWRADNSAISNATSSTYTLADTDVGKVITVMVSFTDDAGNDENVVSAATVTIEAPLTAEAQDVPASHAGSGTFAFRILFSEPVTVSYVTLKAHSFNVSDGTITKAQRVDGRNDLWKLTIEPSSDADVALVLPVTDDCSQQGAICTSSGNQLSNRLEITVPGPLTGTFDEHTLPESHDGSTAFTFELYFSQEPELSYVNVRDHMLTVQNGDVTKAQREDPHGGTPNMRWIITVEPDGDSAVTVMLPSTTGECSEPSAVCTGGGEKLSNTATITVAGP